MRSWKDAYVRYSYVERMKPKTVDTVWLKTAVMKSQVERIKVNLFVFWEQLANRTVDVNASQFTQCQPYCTDAAKSYERVITI